MHICTNQMSWNTKTNQNSNDSMRQGKGICNGTGRQKDQNVTLRFAKQLSVTMLFKLPMVPQYLLHHQPYAVSQFLFCFIYKGREGTKVRGDTFSFYRYFSITGIWSLGWDIRKIQLIIDFFRNCCRNFRQIFDCKLMIIWMLSIAMKSQASCNDCIFIPL